MKIVNFRNRELELKRATYPNGNTALVLETLEGEPYLTASVNLGAELYRDEVYIKNYTENEGIFDMLKEEGVIKGILGTETSKYVTFTLCKINLEDIRLI